MITKSTFVTLSLLIAAAGTMQGAIVETLSIDLSPMHAGSDTFREFHTL